MNSSSASQPRAERDDPSEFSGAQRPLYAVKANLFKGLAHPVRVRVLEVLAASPEVSVADLLDDTGLEASNLSQHLSVLRRYGLVVSERRASVVYYRLAYAHVADLLRVARLLLGELLQDSQRNHISSLALPAIASRQ